MWGVAGIDMGVDVGVYVGGLGLFPQKEKKKLINVSLRCEHMLLNNYLTKKEGLAIGARSSKTRMSGPS